MVGEEYLSSNGFICYPLVDDQNVDEEIRTVLVDAKIVITTEDEVKLVGFEFSAVRGSASVSISFQVGEDSPITISGTTDQSKNYWILKDENSGTAFVLDVKAMFHYRHFENNDLSFSFLPSVIEKALSGVTSITLYGNGLLNSNGLLKEPTSDPISGHVSITPKYNMTVENRDGTITLSAIAGSGEGKVPCDSPCEHEYPEHSLANLGKNASIEADDCFSIVPDPESGKIKLVNKCVACCQCEDYAAEVEKLQDTKVEFLLEKNKSLSLLNDYKQLVQIFNAKLSECDIEEKVFVSVSGSKPEPDVGTQQSGTVNGTYERVRARGVVVNVSNKPADVVVEFLGISNMTKFTKIVLRVMNTKGEVIGGQAADSAAELSPVHLASGYSLDATASFSHPGLLESRPSDRKWTASFTVFAETEDCSGTIVKQVEIQGGPSEDEGEE